MPDILIKKLMGYQKYQITRKHEKYVRRRCYLRDVYLRLQQALSEAQLKNLNICEGNLIYTAEDQLLLRYVDNRYWECLLEKNQFLEQVQSCIEAYKFLLVSNLKPNTIRCAFLKALLDVISMGSGCYFLKWDAWYDEWWSDRSLSTDIKRGSEIYLFLPRPSRLKKRLRRKFKQTFEAIAEKYPNIPLHEILKNNCLADRRAKEYIVRCLWEQLWISYSYLLLLHEQKGLLNLEEFKIDFFKRHKWCLERLSRGNPIFINKYKDKICEDLSYALGQDPDASYHLLIIPLREPLQPPLNSDFLSSIQNIIIGCFSPEELSLFNEQDVEGNAWNFEDQIQDRYCSRFPSFASLGDVENRIKETIEECRLLLNAETAEVIREIIFDEVERIAFVSLNTHLWNLEMEKNLTGMCTNPANEDVVKAIDFLVAYLPKHSLDCFALEMENKTFSLREQLLARWNGALFASDITKFQQYLSRLSLYIPNSPSNWSATPSRIDMQAFLGEIDMFFLYPRKGRKLKKFFRRLDTGRVAGGMNEVKRTYISFAEPDRFLSLSYVFWEMIVLVFLISWMTLLAHLFKK